MIATLLTELLGDIPSPAHRTALEICAHSHVTSETLLRAMMGEEAPELFAWLREQPFIEPTGAGLFPHDVVREALEADLRWRDPDGFVDMHRTVHQYLVERVRTAPEEQMLAATGALLSSTAGRSRRTSASGVTGAMSRTSRTRMPTESVCWSWSKPRRAGSPRPSAGSGSTGSPKRFASTAPRRRGEIVAFFAWLRLREPLGADVDPVVDAAWAHARSAAPLRPGEHMALARFHVHPPAVPAHVGADGPDALASAG